MFSNSLPQTWLLLPTSPFASRVAVSGSHPTSPSSPGLSAICERADLLLQHGILGDIERERLVFFVRPVIADRDLTIYFEP